MTSSDSEFLGWDGLLGRAVCSELVCFFCRELTICGVNREFVLKFSCVLLIVCRCFKDNSASTIIERRLGLLIINNPGLSYV